jgi:lipoyl(octanoyl) transferase
MKIEKLGTIPYQAAYDRQKELVSQLLVGNGEETVFICQHPAVITVGRGTKPGSLLAREVDLMARGIELRQVERGGDVMLHCPGQLVVYPVLRLKQRVLGLKEYMRLLEEVILRTLDSHGVEGQRRQGYTGAWVDGRKIGFAGVAVKNWISYHGLALNISPDLRLFDLLVSCGIADVVVTSLEQETGKQMDIGAVGNGMLDHLVELIAEAGTGPRAPGTGH